VALDCFWCCPMYSYTELEQFMKNIRNKIKYISTTCLSAAILLALPIAAHAVTFNLSPEGTPQPGEGLYPPSSQPYNGIVDFNSGSAPTTPPISYSGGTIKDSTQTNKNYAPANDTSKFLIAGQYYNTSGAKQNIGSVNISFSAPVKYFGMYWGLVNNTNTVTFRNASNQSIGTFTGQNLFNTGQVSSQGSKYVNFFAGNNESISQIILSDTSGTNGFETDNHVFSYKVPFGFSPGLGIVGLGAWGAIVQFKRRWQQEKSINKPALAE
jgi:hypothetical protein